MKRLPGKLSQEQPALVYVAQEARITPEERVAEAVDPEPDLVCYVADIPW